VDIVVCDAVPMLWSSQRVILQIWQKPIIALF